MNTDKLYTIATNPVVTAEELNEAEEAFGITIPSSANSVARGFVQPTIESTPSEFRG